MTITNDWGKSYCVSWFGDVENKLTIQDVIDTVCP